MSFGFKQVIKVVIAHSPFLVAALLAGCLGRDVTTLEIVNQSSLVINNVAVKEYGQEWRLGRVNPGDSVRFSARLDGEGDARLFWVERGKMYSTGVCYYSQNFPANGKIFIRNGKAEYKCSNDVS